jgi:hypothetical protein
VCAGDVFWANAGDTSWSTPANDTGDSPPLNQSGVIFSAVNQQIVYFADGAHWVFFTPLGGTINPSLPSYGANTLNTWTPATTDLLGNSIASVFPIDADGNLPRLICNWRQRICLAGLLLSPQDVFMSAQSDPTNFDYSPTFTSQTQAVALNAQSSSGQVGDVVTALIPYTNDQLVIGCDHSIFLMDGDPMAGGQLVNVSNNIGIAYGAAWTVDPYGNIYFFSNHCGIYTLVPGQAPTRISQQIEQLLANIDTGQNTITLLWNDRFQGLHVFISPTATNSQYAVKDAGVAQSPVTHLFYEQRTGAWWQDQFANQNHNPLTAVIFDGNTPDDRVPIIGSWDGYARAIDPFATTDDSWPINSEVLLGPILTQDFDDMMCQEVQGIMGEESGDVTISLYIGSTAEKALSSQPTFTGTLTAGRNYTKGLRGERCSGHAIYIGISSSNAWQMEGIRCRIEARGLGKVRRRAGPY